MRLGDLDALSKQMKELLNLAVKRVNDTPTNSPCYRMYVAQESERARLVYLIDNVPTCKCKTCRYYHPYFIQSSNEPRGDGYCVIARMTPEGMTTINCNDDFGCSYYAKGGAK